MIGVVGQVDFFEILDVYTEEDINGYTNTKIILRENATFNSSSALGLVKDFVFSAKDDVLSLDAFGRTDNGLSSGKLIASGPAIIKALLNDMGLADRIDTESFRMASVKSPQEIGLAIPSKWNDTETPIYRDIINEINASCFTSLIQDNNQKLKLVILEPSKSLSIPRFNETDMLEFKSEVAGNLISQADVVYSKKEHNWSTGDESESLVSKVSEAGKWLIQTGASKQFQCLFNQEKDAKVLADKWAFLLENSSLKIQFKTKMQGILLDVGAVVEVEHPKFFERFNGESKKRICLVESLKKSANGVEIVCVDLNGLFNRVAVISNETKHWDNCNESERLYSGFITDSHGLVDGDSASASLNLIF